ncbi:efflux RND transporter periplasmic adaptor subunit [Gilvimarinus xylanilyticus]|uniref:Efflux RND transporter periplasmic adaptor subunit n=1 Tax=Gilvimarinus xylanilyticus TaxID=2944139 RepID=A0A9X2HZ64_9GAMM|nr:efflux RND transporter periplasmic adaptor subunit [Gilvimarinus xylanilyticus]MCP8899191.1 efflux RND transporter periplasmic adaptor subunit [Gilvimarinus xylanilyticus]
MKKLLAPEGMSYRGYIAAIALLLAGLGGCSKSDNASIPSAPPPAVTVYTVTEKPVGSYREFVGRTQAHRTVQITARVEGELTRRGFTEGAMVSEGQILYTIDDAPYVATVQGAEAELERARSEVERTTGEFERGQQLAPEGFLSAQDLEKLKAAASQAQSAVKAAESQLAAARINLGYTKIAAPFAGLVGKTHYNVGTVVGPSSGTLVELSAADPIYVNFQLEESAYISYLQKRQREGAASAAPALDISLRLPNNEVYAQEGSLTFADTQIDPTMGAVNLRAQFPNPDGLVVPGMYVTLLVEGREKVNKVVIPQSAVQSTQEGYTVLVVDDGNTVAQKVVEMGRRIGPMWAVDAGLSSGDRIIIDGLQKVRVGIEVKPIAGAVDPTTGAIAPLENGQ